MSAQSNACPDLETLFTWLEEGDPRADEHLSHCEACGELLEAHRQLEKDLLRLSDPLPPPQLLHQVMARVEAQPVPVGREVWTGVGIVAAAVAGIALVLLTDAVTAGAFGTQVASALISLKTWAFAGLHALGTLWEYAAVPLTSAASLMLMFVLMALRRVAAGPRPVRVTA